MMPHGHKGHKKSKHKGHKKYKHKKFKMGFKMKAPKFKNVLKPKKWFK